MKILHTADWQIGKHYRNIPGDAGAVLRQQRFDTVKRIADLAQANDVAAVLVAGDVFDSNKVDDDTLRRTVNAMAGFAGPWVLLAGNHDAATAHSVWTRLVSLDIVPDNIFIASKPAPLELAGGKLCVLPAPLQRRHESRDLTEYFDQTVTAPGVLRVGVAHGSVSNRLPDKAEADNPISDSRAESADLDYLALGDWHGMLNIADRTWYSGTPEQDRFRANEPGFVLLVDLEPGKPPVVEPVRTGKYTWTRLDFSFADPTSQQLLIQKLQEFPATSHTLLDLRVSGMIDLEGRHQLGQAMQAIRANFHYLKIDDSQLKTTPSATDIATMGASGFLADTVKQLLAKVDADDEQSKVATRALQILYFEQLQQATKG